MHRGIDTKHMYKCILTLTLTVAWRGFGGTGGPGFAVGGVGPLGMAPGGVGPPLGGVGPLCASVLMGFGISTLPPKRTWSGAEAVGRPLHTL